MKALDSLLGDDSDIETGESENTGLLSNLKATLSGSNDSEVSEYCGSLSWSTRIIGFSICLAVGVLLNFFSAFNTSMIAISPARFAVPYTLGNLTSIMSTGFLIGPFKQIKAMFDRRRIIATLCYFFSMGLTLVLAFKHGRRGPLLLCIVFQTCSFVWYSISYIPYGQEMLLKALSCIFNPFNDTM